MKLIASSRGMTTYVKLDIEKKYISQAVNMLIGQGAEVFVGNGVCFQFIWRYPQNP